MTNEIRRDFDAFDTAEKLTGKSYKDDENTALLGLGLAIAQNKRIAEQQKAAGDSFCGITNEAFLQLAYAEGFALIHTKQFKGKSWSGEPAPDENFFSLWNPDGVLLAVETFGAKINTAKTYYNLKNYPQILGSAAWHDGVLIGSKDVREDFRAVMRGLRVAGIVKPWVRRPFMWLLTYMDSKEPNYDYEKLNAEMIANYPEEVRACIGAKS